MRTTRVKVIDLLELAWPVACGTRPPRGDISVSDGGDAHNRVLGVNDPGSVLIEGSVWVSPAVRLGFVIIERINALPRSTCKRWAG